jgi:hypothetical protein
MFSASSGYAAAAARGYYDPLLVSGRSRTCVALANLSAAVLPGALAWIAITVTAAILGRADLALTMHRHVAMVIVSAVAWAGGLALPRMAAGALWSLALVTLAMSRLIPDYLFLVRMSPVGLHHEAAALTFAICPYLLLGDFTAASEPRVIGVDMLLVGALVWVGVRYIARREYPLVEPV